MLHWAAAVTPAWPMWRRISFSVPYAAFPVAGDSRLSSGRPIDGDRTGRGRAESPDSRFVDTVVAANQAELDAVSFELEADTPAEAERITSALRSALDDGLGSRALADSVRAS